MATYYKYAERSVDSMVNWAEIGKNITDMLGEENRIREEKKAAIDQATREFGKKLAEAPQGENRDVNKWTLNYADDATQAMLLQDRLLKSGRTKLKDYNINRQNLVDGTNVLFNLSKEYQDEYKIKMERMKSTDPATRSQAIEDWLMGSVEGFSNFSESKPLINPTDYTVNVGMMKKNPETGVMELTDDVASVNSLRNRIKSKFDYFDVDNANVGIAGKLAEYVNAEIQRGGSTKAGFVITTEDAMKRQGYQKALDEAINSMLVSPFNISSILTENIGVDQKTGKAFSFTFDEKEAKANSNLILMKTENDMPVPQFTEDQRKAASSFMKGQIEQMIKRDEKINPYAEPRPERATQYELAFGRQKENAKDMGNMIGQLYSGNDQEVTAAINYFNGLSSVQQAKRDKNGVTITFTNGNSKTIPFYDKSNKEIGRENFVRQGTSLLLGDEAPINDVVAGSLRTKSNLLNRKAEATGQTSTAPKANPIERFKEMIKAGKEAGIDYGQKQR
jgi:hypothetical protein